MAKDKTQNAPSSSKKKSGMKKLKEDSVVVVTQEKKSKAVPAEKPKTSKELSAVLAQHPTNKVNEALAGQAIDALLAFTKRQNASKSKSDLFDSDGDKVHMQITLKSVPGNPSPKPITIPTPHPVRGNRDCEMCLFVKKDDKPWIKETLMEGDKRVEGLAKVITLDKLRTSYARFEQRRELLATYDMFLADDRILPMLCKTLGKTFFSRKKQPVPVKVTRKESLPFTLQKARDSTFMFLNPGTCTSICIGTTTMSRKQLLENLLAITPLCVNHIPRKWKNVQAIQLKTDSSASLPILNKLPFNIGELMQEVAFANEFDATNEGFGDEYGTDSEHEENNVEGSDSEEEEEVKVPEKKSGPKTPKSTKKTEVASSKKRSADEVEAAPISTKKPKTPKAKEVEVEAAPVSTKKPKTPKAKEVEVEAAPVSTKKPKTPKAKEVEVEVEAAPVSTKKPKTPKAKEVEVEAAPVSIKKPKTPKAKEVEVEAAPVSTKKPKTPKAKEVEVEAAPVSTKKPKTPKSAAKKANLGQ